MSKDLDNFLRHLAPRCHVCAKLATRRHTPQGGHTFWKVETGLFRIVMGAPSIFTGKEIRDSLKRYFERVLPNGCPELVPYLREVVVRPWDLTMGPFLCDDHTTIQGQPVVELDHAHLVRGVDDSGERPTRFERILDSDA